MSTPTVKERQHQVREEAILDAAYEMLVEQDYDKLNMDDLAHRVGIAKATLYQHFPSKADVLVGVALRAMQQSEAEMFNDADALLPPLERLGSGLHKCLAGRIKVNRWKVNSNTDAVKNHEQFKQRYDHLIGRLADLLEQARVRGELNPDLSVRVAATTIGWLFRIDYDAFLRAGDVTPEQAIDTLVTMTVNGLRKCSLSEETRTSPQ